MAKYSDAITEAEVGDIVKCIQEGLHFIGVGCRDVVDSIQPPYIRCKSVKTVLYPPGFFELVSRAPSPEPEQPAVNNEQSPPLVVWPEETPTIYKDLNPGERFVFASSPQVVRMIIDGGNYVITDKSNDPYYNQIGYVSFAEADYPVRRVKYVTAPQFTVI